MTRLSAGPAELIAKPKTPGLLVSVRNAREAAIVVRHRVAVVDVKEPRNGALGRASNSEIEKIAAVIPGSCPFSVALGEVAEAGHRVGSGNGCQPAAVFGSVPDSMSHDSFPSHANQRDAFKTASIPADAFPELGRTAYAKFGLAGLARHPDWKFRWQAAVKQLPPDANPVAVVYADYEQCAAPDPQSVICAALELGCTTILLDTFLKKSANLKQIAIQKKNAPKEKILTDNRNSEQQTVRAMPLFDWMSEIEVSRFVHRCRDAGLVVALAGSIGLRDLRKAIRCGPDLIGVRGAVCRNHRANLDESGLVQFIAHFENETGKELEPLQFKV